MVLTTTELTNIRNDIKTGLVTDFVEVAFGSGSTTETAADTALANETLQQARQDYSNLADRVVISGFAGAGQINGTNINEIGCKDAASGNLLQRKVTTLFSKTSSKEFWFDLVMIPLITQS